MTEWKLPQPHVSTFAFHEHRERAPHLEQPAHRPRLLRTAELVLGLNPTLVVDLGCGDGGLLSLLKESPFPSHGYDWQPSNQAAWEERGVLAELEDWTSDPTYYHLALGFYAVTVMAEVLEHLECPHRVLGDFALKAPNVRIVASSPAFETGESYGDCHRWAWDYQGYEDLFRDAGFDILHHEVLGWSQLLVAGTGGWE